VNIPTQAKTGLEWATSIIVSTGQVNVNATLEPEPK
jgi:hypothetical protein